MANDNAAEILITGNAEGFSQAARQVTKDMEAMTRGMAASIGNIGALLGGMQGKFLAIGSAIGGGKLFKESTEAVKEQTIEALKLANALGITAENGNILATALGNVHLTSDVYLDGTRAVTRALNSNESGFKKMGIATRDANGDLLPMQQIIANTASALQEYKAGADRNVMANQLLGRSYEDVMKISKINDEVMRDAKKEVEDYHKQLDPEMVQRYRDSMENLGDVGEGFSITIGKSVMPVVTDLAEWMSESGPTAAETLGIAMDALNDVVDSFKGVFISMGETASEVMSVISGAVAGSFGVEIPSLGEIFKNVFRIARATVITFCGAFQAGFEVIRETLELAGSWLMRFNNVALAAFKLDWNGVKSAWTAGVQQAEQIVAASSMRMAKIVSTANAKIHEALTGESASSTPVPSVVNPKGGSKRSFSIEDDPKPKKAKKEPAEKSMMQYYEAMLANEKQLASERDALRGMTKEEEVAFWQNLIATANVGSKDRLEIDKKMANLSIEINRGKAIQEREDLAETTRFSESYALAEVEQRRAAAQLEVELGISTKERLLVLEAQFERERYEIQKRAAEERRALAESDPTTSVAERARLNNALLELDRQHITNLAQIQGQQKLQSNQIWTSMTEHMGGLWDKGVTAMMNGTLRWKNATHAIWMDLGGAFANNLLKPIIMGWAKSLAQMLAQKLGFAAAEKTIDTTSAATSTSATTGAAITKVTANAAAAGSGAASAMSSIPYVGPILAVAAMGAMVASVMGLMGGIKSASNGFDIPYGVNPMVQAHTEEMVLPKGPSNVIRQLSAMAENGQLSGAAKGDTHYHVQAIDAKSFHQFLRKNQGALVSVMGEASANRRGV